MADREPRPIGETDRQVYSSVLGIDNEANLKSDKGLTKPSEESVREYPKLKKGDIGYVRILDSQNDVVEAEGDQA